MKRLEHLRLNATYNQWMNEKLYAAAATLPSDTLHQNLGAFFGSIFGTLNHLAVGDTLWLKRFAQHRRSFPSLQPLAELETPQSLDALLFSDLPSLTARRVLLDQLILRFLEELPEDCLDEVLEYKTTKGMAGRKDFGGVLAHFFNHQTHHRGQASTLLSQQGVDVGVTDLLVLLPNVDQPSPA
ncbi:MAG: damage-inducible protein DinB [Rubrivivax sp.]|nr:MAG: damage-inducible protein DinB [Rubrivivax sp.]